VVTATDEAARVRELEEEVRELRRANEILKRAGHFLRGGARPPTAQVVAFIDAHRDAVVEGRPLGVEPICRVLQVAPSTYYAAKNRPLSQRARRDAELTPKLVGLWRDNYRVYGARRLWKAARRAGVEVGRDQVARLMRAAGIRVEGARRTKRVWTTWADPVAVTFPRLLGDRFPNPPVAAAA
jgi:hypothetical protein